MLVFCTKDFYFDHIIYPESFFQEFRITCILTISENDYAFQILFSGVFKNFFTKLKLAEKLFLLKWHHLNRLYYLFRISWLTAYKEIELSTIY